MTIEEIRRNAPDDESTHYDDDGEYYKFENGKFLIWNHDYHTGFWDTIYCDLSELEIKPLN